MFLVRLFVLICLSKIKAEIRLEPGVPLPHAEELERMIRANLFPKKKDDVSFVEYFGGYLPEIENDTLIQLENLDFSVLDRDGLRNILALAMQREKAKPSRRDERHVLSHLTMLMDKKRGLRISNRTMTLMQQSIYATRYMIEKTLEIRKMYRNDYVFQLGIIYGNLMELRSKAANSYTTMLFLLRTPMEWRTVKFARFLWIYERILAIHTDVTSNVQRMFILYAELHRITTVQVTEESESTTDDD